MAIYADHAPHPLWRGQVLFLPHEVLVLLMSPVPQHQTVRAMTISALGARPRVLVSSSPALGLVLWHGSPIPSPQGTALGCEALGVR
jgi:hypothetical protein